MLRTAGVLMCIGAAFAYLRRTRRLRVITVVDGDTLIAVSQNGKKHKLRVRGVDCPELGQRMAFEAKEFVQGLVLGQWVDVRFYGRDKYRRQVASIRANGKDVAKELVSNGFGFPLDGRFKLASLGARLSRKGVWSGMGQAKPWESSSRKTPAFGFLNRSKQWRTFKRKKHEAKHKRKQQR